MASLRGFRVEEELHSSDRAVVYRATRLDDQAPVIVKALRREYPAPRDIAAFRKEFEVVERLAEEGVEGVLRPVAFHGKGKDVAMVFEYLPGVSLQQHIPPDGLPVAEVLDVAIRLTRTIGAIHQAGIVHKDIKPSNVVVDPEGRGTWLIDFGISTPLESIHANAQRLEGSIAYMSPEQTGRMNRPVDYRTDFYSLGVTIYEAISGQRPFDMNDPLALVHAHIALEPVPLHVLRSEVSEVLSRLVQRLLAKTAEARYQSAAGLVTDLEALRAGTLPEGFELGGSDTPDRFQLPGRLYGRRQELAQLLAGFERAGAGRSELLMVSGYSGIGKSALIHEVHKPIVHSRGYFIAGKFDQFKRNIPYASMIQAFGDLIQQLLTESEARIASWRERILAALGGIAGVATEVLPELEMIVGEQPRVPELTGAAAQNRLNRTFVEFVRVFARAEHPLVLFLDDLQWADRPTLNLLRLLATEDTIGHLMVIGCYRDNEVADHHPLALTIQAVDQQRSELGLTPVARLHLDGLDVGVLGQLVADCLRAEPEETAPLARLIHEKTLGNPFFVNQFLQMLHVDGLLRYERGRWTYRLDEIEARAITDNVVALMTRKIGLLPERTQATLRVAAAVGNVFELRTLAACVGRSPAETAEDLWEALSAGLVIPMDDSWRLVGGADEAALGAINPAYRFLHDRVQQAAYAMIPEDGRATTHLRIGRAMLEALDEQGLEDRLFTVVDQLKHGLDEVSEDRVALAGLFARAGDKARLASAHEPALEYFGAAQRLLGDDLWGAHYAIGQPVLFQRSASEYLVGNFEVAEGLFDELVANSRTDLEKAQVYRLKLSLYQSRGLFLETVDIAYRGLAHLGVALPRSPSQLTFLRELAKFKWKLRGRSEDDLKQLPVCTDPIVVTALDIMNDFSGPAFFVDINIYLCVVLTMCSLSLEHGNAAESAYCWTLYGMMNGPIMGNVPHGMALGRVGEHIDAVHSKATLLPKVALSLGGLVYQWGQHPRLSLPYFEKGFQAALESGDPTHAGYCANFMVCMFSVIGEPLSVIEETTSRFWSFARKNQIEVQSEIQIVERQMARALMGRTASSESWDDEGFDEAAWLAGAREFQSRQPLHNYLIEKQATLVLLGHPDRAVALGDEAATMLDVSLGIPISSNFHLFYGLANALLSDRPGAVSKLKKMVRQHRKWARHNPDGFEHKRLLLEAELARVRGRADEAEQLYEQAIAQAASQGFVHHQAIANERAARHFLARGRERLGRMSLREARHAYQRWGADAVVARLDAEFPDLGTNAVARPTFGTTATDTSTSTRHGVALDLETILRASQVISREIVLAELLEKLMWLLLENAGARRVVLILRDARGGRVVQAEQLVGFEAEVLQGQAVEERADLAHSALNLVTRTRQSVVIDDVRAPGALEKDPYLRAGRAGSLACAPLLHGGEVMGLLHLENELVTGAFTPERLELLRLLSAQIAISIENAAHYRRAEQTAQAFARFVPQQFLHFLGHEELAEVALGDAVQQDMTVLFADIRSFTAMSERMSPSENMAFLNEYLQQVSPVMRTHGGFIDKYIGDAVMALFPGSPDDAVRAAVAMHREVARLNERRVARGDPPIHIGVGLHYGTLMLGTIGEPERMDTTVISDAVNTSSRLEGLTKLYGTPILISGPTLALCRDPSVFRHRYLGEVRLRGRAAAVALHEIYDTLDDAAIALRDATRARLETAVRHLHAGELEAARAGFEQVVAADPGDRAAAAFLKRVCA